MSIFKSNLFPNTTFFTFSCRRKLLSFSFSNENQFKRKFSHLLVKFLARIKGYLNFQLIFESILLSFLQTSSPTYTYCFDYSNLWTNSQVGRELQYIFSIGNYLTTPTLYRISVLSLTPYLLRNLFNISKRT